MGHLHRLIAFDLDGTLIDSCRDLAESANALIVERGGIALPEDDIARMVGGGAALLVRRALEAAGQEFTPPAVERFLEIYDTRLLNHTHVYDGLSDVLDQVRGRARLVVLTNKPLAPSVRLLEALGLSDDFAEVIGGDSALGRKPDPAGLLALMKSAGARPDRTLMVGDSLVDLETAQRAATRACIVSYGFGFRTFPDDRLREIEWCASDAPALAAVIERFLASSD